MHGKNLRVCLATLLISTWTRNVITAGPNRLPRQFRPGTGRCNTYTIINARGTFETPNQESKPFVDINRVIRNRLRGGQTYLVNYPAAVTQNSQQGTDDIVNRIAYTLSYDPGMCFFLEGYSQGAAAIINALPQLLPYYDAIRGIAVVGNPKSSTGLQSLFDFDILFRDRRTRVFQCKTLDICAYGDPICGLPSGGSSGLGHTSYTLDTVAHDRVIDFAREALTTGMRACYRSNAMQFYRRDHQSHLDDDDFDSEIEDDEEEDIEDILDSAIQQLGDDSIPSPDLMYRRRIVEW